MSSRRFRFTIAHTSISGNSGCYINSLLKNIEFIDIDEDVTFDEHRMSKCSNSPLDTFTPLYPRKSLDFLFRMRSRLTDCKMLKDSCLYQIILNFDSIMQMYFCYEKHGCAEMMQYEYLKRLYSKTLFETLTYLKKLKKSHLPFLLNEHLTELNLSVYPFSDLTALMRNTKDIKDTVTCLNVSSQSWRTHQLMSLISSLPNLKVVRLDFTEYKNKVLGCIKKQCSGIKYISLSNNSWVTDRSLHFLCSLDENDDLRCNPVLEHLDLEGTSVTNEGIQFALKYFPSLNFLRNRYVAEAIYALHQDNLRNGDLENLSKYSLCQMCIYSDTSVLDVLKICTVLCPLVSSLSVNKISVQAEMDLCLKFRYLKKVQLVFDQHSNLKCPAEFFCLYGDNLEKLYLSCTQLSVTSLSKCRKLRELKLTRPMYEELDSSLLHSSHTFKHLICMDVNTADLSMKNNFECVLFIIASSPNLERLVLHQVSGVPDKAIDLILECQCIASLVELDLSFTTVKASDVKKCVVSIPKLTRIIIEYSGISLSEYNEINLLQKKSRVCPIEIIWKDGQWFH